MYKEKGITLIVNRKVHFDSLWVVMGRQFTFTLKGKKVKMARNFLYLQNIFTDNHFVNTHLTLPLNYIHKHITLFLMEITNRDSISKISPIKKPHLTFLYM